MSKSVLSLLFAFFLLLISYQDSPFGSIIGEIARSPIFFFLPVLLVWFLISKPVDNPAFNFLSRLFLGLILVYISVTVLNIFYWFVIAGRGASFLGENVVVKAVKEVLYFIQFYIIYLGAYKFFESFREVGIQQLRLVLTGFLVFLLLILGVEILTMPTAFSFLHTEVPYYRIRLLTSESSWTGSIIIVFGVIYLVLASTKKQLAFGYLFLLINILFTGSKMILICLPIAVFFILMRNVTAKKLLGIAVAGLLFYLLLLPQLINSLSVDLEQYTSIVSRSTAFLTAFLTGGHSVIGVGGLYPYYFINTIQDSLDLILNFIPLGNTSEVEGWGTEGFKAISGGSTLAHFTMQMGVFGILFFGTLAVKLYSITRVSNYLFFGVIYFVVSNMFTEIFLLRHAWPVFFAFVVFYNKYQDELKNTGRYA